MSHIDEIELEQLLDGNLPLVRNLVVRAHLTTCKECQAKLEELRKTNEELRKMAPVLQKLNEADRQSEASTMGVVTQMFSHKAKDSSD